MRVYQFVGWLYRCHLISEKMAMWIVDKYCPIVDGGDDNGSSEYI